MAPVLEFEAIIQGEKMGGAYVTPPFDVEKIFEKKRIPIIATFDGVEYQGTLVRYGSPDFMLLIRKEIQQQIGKGPGDVVFVTIREDLEIRKVEIPEDFRQALAANQQATTFFEKLSFTHQKEYVNWILEAKRPETRRSRIEKAVQMLTDKKKER